MSASQCTSRGTYAAAAAALQRAPPPPEGRATRLTGAMTAAMQGGRQQRRWTHGLRQ